MKHSVFATYVTVLAGILLLSLTACDPEEPVNPEEEINAVVVVLEDGTRVTWRESDTDDPTITLAANSTTQVDVEFRNEEENEDVTAEVREEDDEHLVCYAVMGGNLEIAATDSDGVYPVGLETEWTTGDASTSTLILTLRHQPDVKDGTCDVGDTDVEVTFNVVIQ